VRERSQSEKREPRVFETMRWCRQLSQRPAFSGRARDTASKYRSGMLAAVKERRLRLVIAYLGITQLALGLFQVIAPGTFFDLIADYGEENDHFLRDISTFYLALGVVLLVAVERPGWRIPTLAFGVLQYALHTINHLVDIGDADPGWIGPFNFVALLSLTLLFLYALRESARPAT
jgi:phage-related holin